MDNGFVVLPELASLVQVNGAHTPGLAISGHLAIHPLKYASYGRWFLSILRMKGHGVLERSYFSAT
jgi:hypothetical protein